MDEKSIYAVDGFIPSDEDVVVVSIYKLIKFGKDIVYYAWVKLNGTEQGGIGTLTDSFGKEDRDEVLLNIKGYLSVRNVVKKCSFEDILIAYNKIKEELEAELKENK